jgi:hypothetical protein
MTDHEDMSNACFECVHYKPTNSSQFASCKKFSAQVTGNEWAIRKGYFHWPSMFMPEWLEECDSFKEVIIPETLEGE